MQNLDFYNGAYHKNMPPQYGAHDPEYFTRMAQRQTREEEKSHKKTNRMLSFIIGLCILSFTSGLIIGIKFAAGPKKELVNKDTKEAVSNLGKKVTDFLGENNIKMAGQRTGSRASLFPKQEFPYVIRIGNNLPKSQSQEIAGFLSSRGHTVIISKNRENYNMYTGPFRKKDEAELTMAKIRSYPKAAWFDRVAVIER